MSCMMIRGGPMSAGKIAASLYSKGELSKDRACPHPDACYTALHLRARCSTSNPYKSRTLYTIVTIHPTP